MASSDPNKRPRPGPWPPLPESTPMPPPSSWAKRTGFRPKFSGETNTTDSRQTPAASSNISPITTTTTNNGHHHHLSPPRHLPTSYTLPHRQTIHYHHFLYLYSFLIVDLECVVKKKERWGGEGCSLRELRTRLIGKLRSRNADLGCSRKLMRSPFFAMLRLL